MSKAQTRESIEEEIEPIKQQQKELTKRLKQANAIARVQAKQEHKKHLYEAGGIVEYAGLLSIDRGVLLALLIQSKDLLNDEQTLTRLKQKGEQLLSSMKHVKIA